MMDHEKLWLFSEMELRGAARFYISAEANEPDEETPWYLRDPEYVDLYDQPVRYASN